MVYLGYDFSLPIIEGVDALSIPVKESLSMRTDQLMPIAFAIKNVNVPKLGSRKSILERCGSLYCKCIKFIQS
jgi:hypothetical protein